MWGSPSVIMSFVLWLMTSFCLFVLLPMQSILHVTVQWLASCSLCMLGDKGTEGHTAVGGTGSLKCHRAPNEALAAVLIVSSRCPALHCQGGIPAIQLSVELVED